MDTLRELMTRNGMECRISLPFTGLLQLKPHYDLVKSSLSNLGEQHDNVTMYKDMMVEHVVREINAVFPLEAVCHLAALQLQEYDRQNATELLLTLEKYLLNNRSISKAADELFIHRNTINYRLNKIEKITNISLNDMSDHLHLLLSCIVLRILKE
jgi:DNA-binding PucR family transcriptional regulator